MSRGRLVLVFAGLPASSTRTWFVGGSLAAHCTIALAILLAPSGRRTTIPFSDVTVVQLAGSVPAPSPPAPRPSPPAPAPREVVKPPEPKPREVHIPDAKAKPKPAKPAPEVVPPPSTQLPPAPGNPIPNGGPAVPGPGAPTAGGITALEAGDSEFAWYRASVIAALRSRWIRPVIDEARNEIVATVAFEVRRDGRVEDVRIESPSGVAVMDRSVLRAVTEASPLPPLPASWREPTLSARFEFRWRPGGSGMTGREEHA